MLQLEQGAHMPHRSPKQHKQTVITLIQQS